MKNVIRKFFQLAMERSEQKVREFERNFAETDQRIKEHRQAMEERKFRLIKNS